MKLITTLFLLSLLVSCQNNNQQKKTEIIPPSISKVESPPSTNPKVEQTISTNTSKQKTKEQLDKLDNEASKTISPNIDQNAPSFRLDTMNEWFTDNLKRYLNLTCEDDHEDQKIFDHNFNKRYENSSDNTEKMDGAIFCLRDISTEPYIAKLIYGRNEGGHATDQVYLLTIPTSKDRLYTLPLSYEIAWDGEATSFESQLIDDHLINRKITVRLGYSNTHPDSLAKQARKETFQTFRVLKSGELQMISSEVKKYNMDKYIDQ